MLVKYWKNFKWFLFIPLIVFVFVFKINSVNAYVYKNSVHLDLSTYNYSGNISGNEKSFTWTLNTPIQKNGYDLLQVRFNYMLFSEQNIVDLNNDYYVCTEWKYNGTLNGYECTDFDQPSYSTNSTIQQGSYYIRAISVNSSGTGTPCFMSSDLEGSLLCPINNNITNIQFSIYIYGYNNFNYSYSISGVSAYWNYDNTDITLQQNQTNTNLQYIYQQQQDNQQYLENDSTNGASTQATGDFTELAQDFNEQLSGVNDLTQLVLLPISLFMDLSTDNCQPLHLQIPYVNMSVDLPCMKAVFNQYFNGLYSIFTTIMSAVICYWVAVKTGALVKEIVDCDNDRIEVIDL